MSLRVTTDDDLGALIRVLQAAALLGLQPSGIDVRRQAGRYAIQLEVDPASAQALERLHLRLSGSPVLRAAGVRAEGRVSR